MSEVIADRTATTEPPRFVEVARHTQPASHSSVTPDRSNMQSPPIVVILTGVAWLEIIAAPIAGLIIGSENPVMGGVVFSTGTVSSLILLGLDGNGQTRQTLDY